MAITDRFAQLRGSLAGNSGDRPDKPSAPRERVTPWQYLREVRAELGKVSWPSRQDVVQGTIRVIVVSLVFAAILGATDFGSQRLLDQVLRRSGATPVPTTPVTTETLPEGISSPTVAEE